MKITEVSASIKLSEFFHSYCFGITAEIETGEDVDIVGLQLMGKAMDIVQKKTGIVPGVDNSQKTIKTTTKPAKKKFTKKPTVPVVDVCDECGAEITQKVLDYSQENYGKKLCFECQKGATKQ